MTGRLLAVLFLAPFLARAGDPPVSYVVQLPPSKPVASPAVSNTVKLPYGVEDVLKLSRAGISEEIILSYIQTSGTIYTLAPNDIVNLKEQGVSDRVVNAMIEQRKLVPVATAQAAPAPAEAQPVQQVSAPAAPPAPVYAPAPAPAPVSTVHVISYPPARVAYYGPPSYAYYRPPYYYGGHHGYLGPRFSIGFGVGFGFGRYGGGCW